MTTSAPQARPWNTAAQRAGGDLLRTAGVTPKETHRTDAVSRTGSDSADAGALTACCAAQRNTQTFLQAGKATARILFLQA